MFSHFKPFFRHPEAVATSLFFFVNCLLFSSWIAHIPDVKRNLGLSDGTLGWCLFAFPLGALASNPIAGRWVGWFGTARGSFISAVLFFFAICIPVIAPDPISFSISLFVIGFLESLVNVSMNALATEVESKYDIRILSTCHGVWSLGGMVGSIIASYWMGQGWSASWHMIALAGLSLSICLFGYSRIQGLKTDRKAAKPEASSFLKPTGTLLLMILVGLTVAMGEGLAFDWSSVYLRDIVLAGPGLAALGYAFFSAAMTFGRLSGDSLIPKFGARTILQVGPIVAGLGLLLAVVNPYPATTLAGFLLLGLGVSLGMPILYSASMRIPNVLPAAGLTTFTTFSTFGFLAGPPIIGGVSEFFGLPRALLFVACLLIVGALIVRFVIKFDAFSSLDKKS
jgi:MFS family permease